MHNPFHPGLWARSLWGSPSKRVATIAVFALFFSMGIAGGYLYDLQSRVKVLDVSALVPSPPPSSSRPTEHEPALDFEDKHQGGGLNILLIGSDSRASEENVAIGGAEKVTGMRSDTTIIAHVTKNRKKVKMVSIPRDSWVDIPTCKRSDGSLTTPVTGKFNTAFALGGEKGDITSAVACTMTTLQELTGIQFDGFVVADFSGLAGLVDAVGGVEVEVETDIDSPKAGGLKLKAGIQMLDGETAVQFSRARSGKGLTGSDLPRISRQHQVMHALVDRLQSKVSDPRSVFGILNELASFVSVSPSLHPTESLGLAWSLRNAKLESVELPVYDRGDGANLLWGSGARDLWESFK